MSVQYAAKVHQGNARASCRVRGHKVILWYQYLTAIVTLEGNPSFAFHLALVKAQPCRYFLFQTRYIFRKSFDDILDFPVQSIVVYKRKVIVVLLKNPYQVVVKYRDGDFRVRLLLRQRNDAYTVMETDIVLSDV